MARRRNFRRVEHKARIVKLLALWAEQSERNSATLNQIAKALEMSPSTYLSEILDEMVNEGELVVVEKDQPGRWTTRFFAICETGTLHRQKFFRRVAVKIKGQNVGQLEMAI